ncbi:sigma-70 family RNA polymerase sigma factor [Kribbella sp. NPDC003557]|uniref:RNA polymerase sigma factor n=1 Tax=Kribbella sp. NPDC003557 TaxID=3154449 RepID=UPI0033ADB427
MTGLRMEEVERAFRDARGPAVATLVRLFGDISLAEDAVQDAFVTAVDRWPRDGVPVNPAGWIVTTARNRAVDVVRRNARGRELTRDIAADRLHTASEAFEGDQLRLMFTCCHPALRGEHQVALTLRLVAGLTLPELASGFLVSEETMSKRLVRAKYKIKAARIPYRIPGDAELPGRLRAVLSVLYLVYNTGADDRDRAYLCAEAIRLTRLLVQLVPAEPEVVGLLALMLLNDARKPARGDRGIGVLLQDQDRSLWDHALIDEGQTLVLSCIRRRRLGPFQLQAAIQALHCAAARYEDTDWAAIVRFYDRLLEVMPTPVVALNRAIALAESQGPSAGLAVLDTLADELGDYHVLHAARGRMLSKLGLQAEAASAYARGASVARTEPARTFLEEQAASTVLY